jgi:Cdc6-like AAA superfamily ATPase
LSFRKVLREGGIVLIVGPRGVGKSALVNYCLHEFIIEQRVKNNLFKLLSVNGLTIRDPSKAMASLVQQFNDQQQMKKNEESINTTIQQESENKIELYHNHERNDTSSFGSHSAIEFEDDTYNSDDEIRIINDSKETSLEFELIKETNVLNSSKSSTEIKVVNNTDSMSTPHQRLNFSLTSSKQEQSDSDKMGNITSLNQTLSNECKNRSIHNITKFIDKEW